MKTGAAGQKAGQKTRATLRGLPWLASHTAAQSGHSKKVRDSLNESPASSVISFEAPNETETKPSSFGAGRPVRVRNTIRGEVETTR